MQESRDAALYHNKLDKLLTSARERSTTKQQAKQPMPQRKSRLSNKRSMQSEQSLKIAWLQAALAASRL